MATKELKPAAEQAQPDAATTTAPGTGSSLSDLVRSVRTAGPQQWARKGLAVVLFLIALLVLPTALSDDYVIYLTEAAVYAIVCLGLAVLVGRVGMVSMGQVAILIIGTWIAARLFYATGLPFLVVLLISGIITMILGVLISLPALRVRGLYLALITLMLASAILSIVDNVNFPNGYGGFWGYNSSALNVSAIRRPAIAVSDPAFLRYSIIIALLMFLLVGWHLRSRPGRAWASIRQSEASALASGINIVRYKLWAFALASFITGVAGGLFASTEGRLNTEIFGPADSIQLLAVVLMAGVYNIYGAVLAGILSQLLPNLLNTWGISPYVATIAFGVGALQVLTTAPAGIIDQMPKDMARLGRLIVRLFRRATPAHGGAG